MFDLQVSRLPLVAEDGTVISSIETTDDTENKGTIRCLLKAPVMFHEFNFSPPASNMKLEQSKVIPGGCSICF